MSMERFSFQYFDSLPLPGDKIEGEARAYVQQRFPSGSDLQDAINEFTAAGAKCPRVSDYFGAAYRCQYSLPGPVFLTTIEWIIVIRPDKSDRRVASITLIRAGMGL
jgi:hypothetical protein